MSSKRLSYHEKSSKKIMLACVTPGVGRSYASRFKDQRDMLTGGVHIEGPRFESLKSLCDWKLVEW